MNSNIILYLLFAIFLVLLNGFFVAAEFSIVKARLSQFKTKAENGDTKAKRAMRVIENLDAYLSATQLGITFASLALGWVAEFSFYVLFGNIFQNLDIYLSSSTITTISIAVSFLCVTCLHILFGELIPKSIAIRNSEQVVYVISIPLIIFYNLFRPFILFMNNLSLLMLKLMKISPWNSDAAHSTQELKWLIKQSADDGEIEHDNYEIIKNALDFDDHSVKQTMVPRQNIEAIDILDSKEEILAQILSAKHSRIPVYEDSMDNIIGLFYTKELLKEYIINQNSFEDNNLRKLVHDVLYVVESKKISDVMTLFKQKKQLLAIVIDEFGGTEGIISLEDILEELVGNITDETDNEEGDTVVNVSPNVFNVIATEQLEDINEYLPEEIELNPESYNTLAGYILHELDELPKGHEEFHLGNYYFKILVMQHKSLELVQITYTPQNLESENTKLVDKKSDEN